MSINNFFKEKLAVLLGVPVEKITNHFLKEYFRSHKKKLSRLNTSRGGGHIASRFLGHVDDDEFERLIKENDHYIEEKTYSKQMDRIR